MSVKLSLLMMVAATVVVSMIALAEAQAPAKPTFEELVKEREATTLHALNMMVASSTAPQQVKDAVLASAQEQLANCVEQASVVANQGQFYACTGLVLRNAAMALNGHSSSGAGSIN
ncbi:uncharacterized protein LOC131425671 [Malaya genurostris]|uniref:uncharacterized protein LOC131425671 n=1 Tax=Malaya genurostris TaxID=325434 RepID=UPI0026F399A3|nr:uncharacterized protein LOC131425671 [Malaya genurostris]